MAYVSSKNNTSCQLIGLSSTPNETGNPLSSCHKLTSEGEPSEDCVEQYPLISDNWKDILQKLDSQGLQVHLFRMEKMKEKEQGRLDSEGQMNDVLQQLSKFDQLIKKHDQQIKMLEEENQQLKIRYDKLDSDYRSVQHENRQLRELLRRQGRRMGERVHGVEQGQKRLDELNRRTMGELERQTRRNKIAPGETSILNLENGMAWQIDEVETVLEGKKDEWGPSFYVGDYKFQLNISTNVVKGYLSFYVALIRGLHDDELEWPFEGEFTFLLSNKENNKDVYRKEFVNTTQQANDNFIKPVDAKNVPIGFPRFISIDCLKQAKYSEGGSVKLTLLVNPKF